jgi:putative N6-adenine-specific DNA methylase
VRLAGSEALAAFYPRLGDALKQRFAGWTAYLLSGDTRLPKLIGLKASRRTPLFNGALECRLYEYRVIAGSLRTSRPVIE